MPVRRWQFLKACKQLFPSKRRSSLATVTLGRIGVILIGAGCLFSFFGWRVVSHQFDVFDAAQYEQDVRRVSTILQRDADFMRGFVVDFATWDDAYDYVHGRNPEFVSRNFTFSTLTKLQLHGVAVVEHTGRVWMALEWRNSEQPQALAAPILQWIINEAQSHAGKPAAYYFLWLDQRPVSIAVAPITDTQNQKRSNARLYFIRYLNGNYQELIQNLTHTAFVFTAEKTPALRVSRQGDQWVAQQAIAPGMGIRVQGKTRLLYERRITSLLLIGNGLLLFLICLGGTRWILQKQVLGRLQLFASRAIAVRETQDYTIRWPVQGDDELDHLATALNQLQATLAQRQFELQQVAYYDSLTGLANRRLLFDYLTHLPASPAVNLLMLLDLDHFKKMNDANGHLRGDELLIAVGHRLRDTVPGESLVARLGGDEFVVVVPEVAQAVAAAEMIAQQTAQQILDALSQPFCCPYGEDGITASIGITLFRAPVTDVHELLQQADLAMYRSKMAGRNQFCLFHPQLQVQIQQRADLEHDLTAALQTGQLEVYYQPQVTFDNRLVGIEALARWWHPQRGWVSPAEFVALAEETGLITPLGNWVLTTACTQLARWAEHPVLGKVDLAVNVSARQVHQPDFVAQVLTILEHTGVDPRRLVLELTESVMLDDFDRVIQKMYQLTEVGVRLALDDFGLGYSALRYLKRLPLSQLKIDRCFVRHLPEDTNDQAIARMIIALAETLNLDVLAEGVEQEKQRAFLATQGCCAYQGYLFAPPLPAPELMAWVEQRVMMGEGVE
ncbi:MAG: EAL domain-containing protein [Gloeomargarita sp. SKYB31]|nr:EAL domain-containing protein [Gloeomargarita sp. SKYB31]